MLGYFRPWTLSVPRSSQFSSSYAQQQQQQQQQPLFTPFFYYERYILN